jgi:hypothetical protein
VIACAVSDEGSGRPVPPAAAGGPAFPSLKKDNCIRNGRHRSVFTAQENIRLYIWKHGPEKIGFLTVTTPSECLEPSAFQEKWHSYLTNVIRKTFPTGMWARERQPRSGNWHAHAVVNVGRDIWTGFPFDQVAKKFYANVDSELRKLWKHLRETAAAHGFGRTELLPLKHSGEACARYITDYLAGAFGSEKPIGQERRRLFSVWGGVRFVYPRFSFFSSRIIQKRKQWLAEMLELPDETCIAKSLGPRWWFHFGKALCEVIMPEDFYKVGPPDDRHFDELGLRALESDWAAWSGEPSDDLMMRSQFNLFYEIGVRLFGRNSGQARDYAMYFMERRPRVVQVLKLADPQRYFGFPLRD